MKKVLSILVLAIVAVQFAFAGDVITKDVKELPFKGGETMRVKVRSV